MKRLQRWSLLIWVCVICVMAACTRSVPRQRSGENGAVRQAGLSESAAPVAIPAPAISPSPAYPGVHTGTPTPNPTPVGHSSGRGVESYVVQPGETLSLIAALFGCTVEEIVAANGIADADNILTGQTLIIPVTATQTGPALKLIPDSELVYSPAYIHFDLGGFVTQQGGYLAGYTEEVEGRLLTGTEILQLVSQRFSVGPRVLLTLLELRCGWITQPQPASGTLVYPLGHVQAYCEGLFQQLSWAALRLNEGYYGWKRGDRTTVCLANGSRAAIASELNPGTAGVQNCLAELSATRDEWLALTGADGFLATYEHFFGNPFAYTADPLLPPDLRQPELRLPWEAGHTWYFTGGPHGG